MDDLDKAIQALPVEIQDKILDHLFRNDNEWNFYNLQVELGWTYSLQISSDLKDKLSNMFRKRRIIDYSYYEIRIPLGLQKPWYSIEYNDLYKAWYVFADYDWWWSDDHCTWKKHDLFEDCKIQ